MELHELSPLVEALLFAADQPVTVNALVKAVDDDAVGPGEVRAVLDALIENYDHQPRGFQLVKLGSGYQVVTRDHFAPWVEAMVAGKRKTRLSRAALETAAVVAYKQPITRLDIERIRGVDAGAVLNTLLERSLVMIKGRDPGPGRPLLYGTTQGFLEYFGLSRLSDLPRLDEIAALARSEAPSVWDDSERARFEKHGVEADAIPAPYDEEDANGNEERGEVNEVEARLDAEAAELERTREEEAASGGTVPPASPAPASPEEGEESEEAVRNADRAAFREALSALAGEPDGEDPAGPEEGHAPEEAPAPEEEDEAREAGEARVEPFDEREDAEEPGAEARHPDP